MKKSALVQFLTILENQLDETSDKHLRTVIQYFMQQTIEEIDYVTENEKPKFGSSTHDKHK